MNRSLHLILFFLLLAGMAQSQPFFPDVNHVFRTDVIPRVDITIHPDSLEWIYQNVDSDHEFKAGFKYSAAGLIDEVETVGFRLRGNTSRQSAKKSFKISFNTFTPGGKFYGIEKMNLNGEHNDPSIIRSFLAWNLFRQMQVVGSRSNHVEVYINNNYYGLYINVEHIDEEFVQSRFGNDYGNLYKCTHPADLSYLGTNKQDYKNQGYELKTNEEVDDFSDIINLAQVINQTSAANFPEFVEPIFNINGFLRYLAVEIFTGHWDAISINRNNFYLFNNKFTDKFEFMPYDVDNTFGVSFINLDSDPDIGTRNIYQWWKDNRPLTSKVFGNPVYRDRFSFFINQLITEFADPEFYFSEIDAIKAKINASAEADNYRTLDYGYTFTDFNRSYTEALGAHVKYGIKSYITTRVNSIKQQLVLNPIAPIVENVYHNFPRLNQAIAIQADITDDEAAPVGKLFYQINAGAWNSVSMTQNTSGKFMAQLPALSEPGTVNYYIEASDASSKVTREPAFGHYSITIGESKLALKITELMAGNSATIVDNYGETDDWIEIRNTGGEAVNLAGLYLTDDLLNPEKFSLPNTVLEPGGYFVVWADDEKYQGPNHANFKLSANGESVGLFDSFETGFASIFTLDYPAQEPNYSSGYNASDNWLEQAFFTPGGENENANVAFITYRIDMNEQIRKGSFNPLTDFIDVAGTYNDWSGGAKVYDGNNDGIYAFTEFGFADGEAIEFKARINADWGTAEFQDLGGDGNRQYTLTAGHNLVEFWYNDEVLGIVESNSGNLLSVFPNPTNSGNVNVNAPFKVESLLIYSFSGALVYQQQVPQLTRILITEQLPKGMYLIKVSGQNRELQSKLMVY
jgi:hypothetical protein